MKQFLHMNPDIGVKKTVVSERLKADIFHSTPVVAYGAMALGALAIGACAIGTLAIGKLVLGKLCIGHARIKKLEIEELTIGHECFRKEAKPACCQGA